MSIFKKKPIKRRSPGERRFAAAYWMVKDLTAAQYKSLKEHMDEVWEASNGFEKIKTPEEKINETEEFLETEVK